LSLRALPKLAFKNDFLSRFRILVKKHFLPLALGGLAIGTTEFVMMGLLPNIAADFHVTIPQAGYAISAYALGVVIGAPLLVLGSRRMAPKTTLMLLMGLFALFNLLSAFALNNGLLCAARLLAGLPHGAFFGVGSVVASRLAAPGKQAQAIASMFSGLTVANVVMVPVATYIGTALSWRFALGGVGVLGLATLGAIQWLLPTLPPTPTPPLRTELALLGRRTTWLIMLLTAIGTGGLFCWISYIAPLLTKVSGFTPGQVPYLLAVAGLGMVAGNALGGYLADRLAPARACLLLLLAMVATLLLMYWLAPYQVPTVLLTFAGGCFALAVAAPIQLLMIRSAQGAEMLGAAFTQAAFNTGNALGAFLGGLPLAAGFAYTSPELVGAAMALGGVGFAVLLLRDQAAQAPARPAEPVAELAAPLT
jgi:DHA1 family arabinose polymer transporter-like MFS transporter